MPRHMYVSPFSLDVTNEQPQFTVRGCDCKVGGSETHIENKAALLSQPHSYRDAPATCHCHPSQLSRRYVINPPVSTRLSNVNLIGASLVFQIFRISFGAASLFRRTRTPEVSEVSEVSYSAARSKQKPGQGRDCPPPSWSALGIPPCFIPDTAIRPSNLISRSISFGSLTQPLHFWLIS